MREEAYMETKKVSDKEKLKFLLEKLYGFVEEVPDNYSLYVPNKEFFFNDDDELIKIVDHHTKETFQ